MRWIVGDIHGMLKPLESLVLAVRASDTAAEFLFVGDYVNRGPDSRGVVDFLISLSGARFIRGNHDDVFDVVLHGQNSAGRADPVPVYSWFMHHGLDRTLASYGVDIAEMEDVAHRPSRSRIFDLVRNVPGAHREFFRQLPLSIEHDDIFVVHAYWPAHMGEADIGALLAVSPRRQHSVMWDRYTEDEIHRPKRWQRRGFFGHTPVINYSIGDESLPLMGPKIVLLDTGVALGHAGRLTAWCVETDTYVQTDHFGRLVSAAT